MIYLICGICVMFEPHKPPSSPVPTSPCLSCGNAMPAQVVKRVRSNHADAFHTAHLEVPGEMFSLAMEAQKRYMIKKR